MPPHGLFWGVLCLFSAFCQIVPLYHYVKPATCVPDLKNKKLPLMLAFSIWEGFLAVHFCKNRGGYYWGK